MSRLYKAEVTASLLWQQPGWANSSRVPGFTVVLRQMKSLLKLEFHHLAQGRIVLVSSCKHGLRVLGNGSISSTNQLLQQVRPDVERFEY